MSWIAEVGLRDMDCRICPSFLLIGDRKLPEHFCSEYAFHYRVVSVPEAVSNEVSVANLNAGSFEGFWKFIADTISIDWFFQTLTDENIIILFFVSLNTGRQ